MNILNWLRTSIWQAVWWGQTYTSNHLFKGGPIERMPTFFHNVVFVSLQKISTFFMD